MRKKNKIIVPVKYIKGHLVKKFPLKLKQKLITDSDPVLNLNT